jgi:hypothetical protein
MEPRLFVETDILRAFTQEQEIDLGASPTEESLRDAPVVCLIASKTDNVWRRYGSLAHNLARAGQLGLNPIYESRDDESGVHLKMAWPSAALEAECRAITQAVPVELTIARGLFERLRGHRLAEGDMAPIETLVQSGVVLPLPHGYA